MKLREWKEYMDLSTKEDDDRALVLTSGGLDSTVLLKAIVDLFGANKVLALNIYYGQRHAKEEECATYQAQRLGVELISADMSDLFLYDRNKTCSLLRSSQNAIPLESYSEQVAKTDGKPVSTYVPFRNGLFLAFTASVALQRNCQFIYYGAHADDAAGSAYPDCSTYFVENMGEAIYFGSGEQVVLDAPFIQFHKSDIVELGLDLGVQFEHTWSCYQGNDKPCGVCGTCRDRLEAFRINGVTDPLQY